MKQRKFLQIVGKRIRGIRKEKKISQEKLAELADLSSPYISDIENGKVNASLFSYYRIANALRISFSTLVMNINKSDKKTMAELVHIFNQARNFEEKKRSFR
jgi:transcriptional regulator with XRE-family HTH domain